MCCTAPWRPAVGGWPVVGTGWRRRARSCATAVPDRAPRYRTGRAEEPMIGPGPAEPAAAVSTAAAVIPTIRGRPADDPPDDRRTRPRTTALPSMTPVAYG